MKKIFKIWLAPLLLAIFPTLVIYNHNIDQLALSRLAVPLTYSLGFVILSGAVALSIFKSQSKAGIFTSLWTILFFSFGYLYLKLGETILVQLLPISLNMFLLGFYGFILLSASYLLIKHTPSEKLSNFFTVIALTTLVLNLWTLIPFEFQRQVSAIKLRKYLSENSILPTKITEPIIKPDIYYIVFDRYARQDILSEQFAFNNEETLQFLKQNGFLVGKQSYANYPNTFLSLASTLNLRYLDFLPQTMGLKNHDRIGVYQQLIQTNELTRFLKSQNYQYVLAGESWDPSKTSSLADVNYNLFAGFDEFQLYIYERSLWNTLRGIFENKQLYTGVERLNKMSQNLALRLTGIKKQVNVDSSKFVFVHLLLPHDPNIFNSECLPMEFAEIRKLTLKEGFLTETQCANVFIKELTNYIQTNSKKPTVIIFQSDEGPYLPEQYFNQNEELVPNDPQAYQIHTAILNAIYIADKENPKKTVDYQSLGLDEQSSPVNTFRAILNYYFDLNLPLLKDKSYVFASPEEPYNFQEITNQLLK